jgi:alkyl hydroperoxide reductase subunit AhpF
MTESVAMRKLIFFCSADPREDTGPFFRAYHFANVAANSGLEAEVRFAGPAVDVTDLDTLPSTEAGDLIRQKIGESVDAKFDVSL